MFRRPHILFATLLAVVEFAPQSHAQLIRGQEIPAFGLSDAIIGCDGTFSDEPYFIAFEGSIPLENFLPDSLRGVATPGEPCLAALAELPPPIAYPLGFLHFNGDGNGADQTAMVGFDHLIWVVHGRQVPGAVIGCLVNDEGELETVLVANGNESRALGDSCFETLANFSMDGRELHGPLAATLGAEGEGTGGGVAWFNSNKGFGFIEMIVCDVDPGDGQFKVTYHEVSDVGVNEASVGRPCLNILAEDAEAETSLSGPLPIPVPRSIMVNAPQHLIWIVRNDTAD